MLDGEQVAILVILAGTLAMFLAGRWRHDVVALAALMACVATGLVEPSEAFLGFGHPAVITVAAVLVLSHGLQTSGAIDYVARLAVPSDGGPLLSLATLVGIGAFISGGMNNVGAMALLMPVAIQIARRHALAPGLVLMPLAFGTILGGMTTLIGTPPNHMAGIGVCRPEDIALSVLTTVIGHQQERGWILIDAGWMALSRDRGTAAQDVWPAPIGWSGFNLSA